MSSSPLRLAFAGFQHSHALGILAAVKARADIEIVGACESDPAKAAEMRARGDIAVTHDSLTAMLAQIPCDAVAIGDVYARHGELAIEALVAGKHVISDKPLCTRLEQLDQIAQLANSKQRSVLCMFDMRGSGAVIAMRRHIAEGAICTVHTVNVTAQHPLLLGSRPGWYFKPGQQGGTLNDIGCHAMDIIPWLTGRRLVEVTMARAWNARVPQYPFFCDAAQFMLRLDNGGGVLGDVSYLAPDGCGYSAPQYWRIACHGEGGVIEARAGDRTITIAQSADRAVRTLEADPDRPSSYLQDFLDEIAHRSTPGAMTTAEVLDASRKALLVQRAADEKQVRASLD